jgi:ADP-ribose pyrophosphatase YjhB (NUDIX family)
MKIFLDEKIIFLTEKKGLSICPAEWAVEYNSRDQLNDLFSEFSSDKQVKNLVIWSKAKNFRDLIHDFFSLFGFIDAAGGIVKNEKDQLLFIFRRGRWDLPKGKVALNETYKKAAVREVMEETGLQQCSVIQEVFPTYHIYYLKKKPVLKCTRWFEMISGSTEKLIPQAKEEITEVKWVGRSNLKNVIGNTYASLRELISKYEVRSTKYE